MGVAIEICAKYPRLESVLGHWYTLRNGHSPAGTRHKCPFGCNGNGYVLCNDLKRGLHAGRVCLYAFYTSCT